MTHRVTVKLTEVRTEVFEFSNVKPPPGVSLEDALKAEALREARTAEFIGVPQQTFEVVEIEKMDFGCPGEIDQHGCCSECGEKVRED